ncbi:MAG: branched-chain amino acid ABC transporter permease [Deltaproteobacteria bacterium]|nr:branched-chain amino acid ABC transporter permease [Deltaproteobacteria bacterium]
MTKQILQIISWLKSAAGITICLSLIAAVYATLDRGSYILVNIVVTGGMLSLVAIGLALVFGVMNIPMFAHGEYFMIGTLVAYFVFTPISGYMVKNPNSILALVGPLIAIGGAGVIGAVMGVFTEKLIFSPLRKRSQDNWVMNSFLLTVGISFILINAHQLLFNPDFKGIIRYWGGAPLEILGTFVSRDRVMAFVVSALVVGSFWCFMTFSKTGRSIRAVSQDETGALMVGINLNGIFILTMSLSCALAAVAGAGLLFMYPSYPNVGLEPVFMAWFVVILAGLGNVLGAVVGAFIMALLKVVTNEYIGAGWEFVLPSAVIMIILIFRPSGIFGSEVRGILDK